MTLAENVYTALRHDIIRGALRPGKPLRLAELSERYGMGFSPLREALNRLQAEKLVTAEALRGFRVAPLSAEELRDVVATRITIETEALRQSIRLGGDDWAAGVVSALYALKLQAGRTVEGDEIWTLEQRHHAFHHALVAACGSVWMLEFCERLYVATERYRIPVLLTAADRAGRDIEAEHSDLAEAALARDEDRAVGLLRDHYQRTETAILAVMARDATESRPAAARSR